MYIVYEIDDMYVGTGLENWAEISSADNDTDETNTPAIDIDSDPDTDQTNDNQPANPGDATDDEVNQDGKNGIVGNDDEDDHDVAGVPVLVYDLALTKILSTATIADLPVGPGDDVTFTIEVSNQGTVAA